MYTEDYRKIEEKMTKFKKECLDNLVDLFKWNELEPITIGNMVYFYTEYKGRDVPAYCYLSDWKGDKNDLLPIYDEEETHEFGWICFNDVARILDVIRKHIVK